MKFCQDHWDRLRAKIEERGLDDLIAPSGVIAAAQIADQINRGKAGDDEPTVANFDPLMGAHWAITSNALNMLGGSVMYLMTDGDEDEIDFSQYRNGEDVRARMALVDAPTWPRCPLCYLNLAHELTCSGCELPQVDGYDWMLDRAADDALEQAKKLGLA